MMLLNQVRGEIPQFELNTDGTYNFNSPFVKPETMNDLEIRIFISILIISLLI